MRVQVPPSQQILDPPKEAFAHMPQSLSFDSAPLVVAASRAADRLGLDDRVLAMIIGVLESAVSHLRRGRDAPAPSSTVFERTALFVRMFTALDAITAGDGPVATAWLANRNDALGDAPINLIRTAAGLTKVVRYLDSRNARV